MNARVRYAAIVLRSSPERVACAAKLATQVPSLITHDAVEKRTLPTLGELVRQGVVAPDHELLTTGQVACALSHLSLLRDYEKHSMNDQTQWFVTLEDDVEVFGSSGPSGPSGPDFEARVSAVLSSLPASADVCYLHVFDGREDDYAAQEEVPGAPGVRRALRMYGTWGVAYRGRAAARLAARLTPLRVAIDNALTDAVEAGEVNAFVCVPPLIRSLGDLGPFDVHRRAMRSTVWHND